MKRTYLITLSVTVLCLGFIGLQAQSVKDIDGNVYKTVVIGNHLWMAENLKTTKYNNGSSIPLVSANSAWEALNSPAFCWYNNDPGSNKNKYGALYNWFVVKTEKLCPTGWHVPTDMEWSELSPLPGGYRYSDGTFQYIKNASYWWTSTESSTKSSFYRGVWWDGSSPERDEVDKRVGYSVRCIKD